MSCEKLKPTKPTTPACSPRRRFVMRPVVSSLISHVGYFSVGLLVLRFNSGDVWAYQPVDRSMWLSLCHVRSKGRWFNSRLRGKVQGAKVEGRSKEVIESYIAGSSKVVQ